MVLIQVIDIRIGVLPPMLGVFRSRTRKLCHAPAAFEFGDSKFETALAALIVSIRLRGR